MKNIKINQNEISLDEINETFIFERLIKIINEKRIYLDQHISLIKTSLLIGTNTTYLSKVINRRFNRNFRGLINCLRICYSKEIIEKSKAEFDPKHIANMSGFVSVSVFYDSFKKEVGVTPLQYQAALLFKKDLSEITETFHCEEMKALAIKLKENIHPNEFDSIKRSSKSNDITNLNRLNIE